MRCNRCTLLTCFGHCEALQCHGAWGPTGRSFVFVVSEDSREQGVDYSSATFRLWRAASVKAGHVGLKWSEGRECRQSRTNCSDYTDGEDVHFRCFANLVPVTFSSPNWPVASSLLCAKADITFFLPSPLPMLEFPYCQFFMPGSAHVPTVHLPRIIDSYGSRAGWHRGRFRRRRRQGPRRSMLIDVQASWPGRAATSIGHQVGLGRSSTLALFSRPVFPSWTDR